MDKPEDLPKILDDSIKRFERDTKKRKIPLHLEEKAFLENLRERTPLDRAVVEAADDWLIGRWQEAAQLPNGNEWSRLQKSPFDGQLGVSFALQWRYNFGVFFRGLEEDAD